MTTSHTISTTYRALVDDGDRQYIVRATSETGGSTVVVASPDLDEVLRTSAVVIDGVVHFDDIPPVAIITAARDNPDCPPRVRAVIDTVLHALERSDA